MLRKIDLVLRFVYVALVPAILAVIAQFMSVMGLVVTTGFATAIALSGTDRWRARVGRVPVAGTFLSNFALLGEYYAVTPPRPVLYYILYPLLFPYWLLVRRARTEFLLYRRISVVVVGFGVVGSIVNYATKWYPDVPLKDFFGATLGLMVLQLLFSLPMIMPIVTTVITYHQRAMKKTLIAVLALATLTGVPAWIFFHRFPMVGMEAQARIKLRTKHAPDRTEAAMTAGLDAALDSLAVSTDGDLALDRLREALEVAYRHDEVHGFHLLRLEHTFAIYAKFVRGKKPAAWRAVTLLPGAHPGDKPTRVFTSDPAQLPPKLREALDL